ncbi:class I SAM-dependent methyltransferase [Nocardioides ungokensis]|uniref:class I SAM-dependent methyltransferase n=1 Tax=Nocardioides ungokensis TaxID=1643322 RepID=UPI0015DF6631|nr:class I SAM-dependent methyltransferase [Nocardioides ungokensis]
MTRAVARSRAEPNEFAQQLFTGLPRRYDVLEETLSFGQNHRWRTAMVDAVVAGRPALVLDVATGTAGVAIMLTDRTPARVVGVDLTEQMLRRGRQRVASRGRTGRITLAAARAERLPFADATFDALTFTYLLRYVADPAATLVELARVVRPGGVVASLEFGVPPPPVWRPAWRLYTRAVLPLAGLVAGGRAWARVGTFLGPSIEQHYRDHPVEKHLAMWAAAGLEDVRARPMSLGGGLVMSGRRGDG